MATREMVGRSWRRALATLCLAVPAFLLPMQGGQAQEGLDPSRRYDQCCWLTAHNAFANHEEDYRLYTSNQRHSIRKQLDNGVRGLMFDVYLVRQFEDPLSNWNFEDYGEDTSVRFFGFRGRPLQIVQAHNPKVTGYSLLSGFPISNPPFRELKDGLVTVRDWLLQNPTEIVTLIFESKVRHDDLMQEVFQDARVSGMVFRATGPNPGMRPPGETDSWDVRKYGWPTLGQMRAANRRLVVFTSGSDGLPYQWGSMVENVFGLESLSTETCGKNRGSSNALNELKRPLLLMNYFPDINLVGPDFTGPNAPQEGSPNYTELNSASKIEARLDRVMESGLRPPNFLAVDNYHKGRSGIAGFSGPQEIVRKVNRLWETQPEVIPDIRITAQINAAGWARTPVRFAISGRSGEARVNRAIFVTVQNGDRSAPIETELGVQHTLDEDGKTDLYYEVLGHYPYKTLSGGLTSRSDRQRRTFRIDQGPPTIQGLVQPARNSRGWNNGRTAVFFETLPRDSVSGIAKTFIRLPGQTQFIQGAGASGDRIPVMEEGEHHFRYIAEDVAGNRSSEGGFTIRLDKTPPTVKVAVTPAPNAAGWNRGPVSMALSLEDAFSGPLGLDTLVGEEFHPYTTPLPVSREGFTAIDYRGRDQADNATIGTARIRIDRTPPVTTASLSPEPEPGGRSQGPVTVTLAASDALSGVRGTFFRQDNGEPQPYSGPVVLEASGAHTFSYWSEDVAGNVETARSVSVTLPGPAAPSALQAVLASPTQADLSWTDGGSDETGFEVEVSVGDAPFTLLAQPPADVTTATHTGLSPDTRHRYRVRAVNGAGKSAFTNIAELLSLGQPANLRATTGIGPLVRLEWTDHSQAETGYEIQRRVRLGAQEGEWESIAGTGAEVTSYVDAAVLPSTTYQYRVRAFSPGGLSPWCPDWPVVTTLATGGRLQVARSVAFGQVRVRQTGRKVLTLRNLSATEGLQVALDASRSAFAIADKLGAVTIPPGRTYAVQLRFSPARRGRAQGVLVIRSSDPSNRNVRVRLSGTGM